MAAAAGEGCVSSAGIGRLAASNAGSEPKEIFSPCLIMRLAVKSTRRPDTAKAFHFYNSENLKQVLCNMSTSPLNPKDALTDGGVISIKKTDQIQEITTHGHASGRGRRPQ
jgi:hypothetical protein